MVDGPGPGRTRRCGFLHLVEQAAGPDHVTRGEMVVDSVEAAPEEGVGGVGGSAVDGLVGEAGGHLRGAPAPGPAGGVVQGGGDGLVGMPGRQGQVVRPLLGIGHRLRQVGVELPAPLRRHPVVDHGGQQGVGEPNPVPVHRHQPGPDEFAETVGVPVGPRPGHLDEGSGGTGQDGCGEKGVTGVEAKAGQAVLQD